MKGWEEQFTVCECHTHALAVSLLEYDNEPEHDEVGISFWSYGHGEVHCWRERLRHIWHIIKRGHPYLDEVCLNRNAARALGGSLIELAEVRDGSDDLL